MTDCVGLDGKSQLMLDFLEVKEQTNDYRSNILELLEHDNSNGEIAHYNEIVQCLNQYAMLTAHSLERQEDQIKVIQELNSWKCDFEQQVANDKSRLHSLENDCQSYQKQLRNLQHEINSGEKELMSNQDELRLANQSIRNYQVKCAELDKELERLDHANKQNDGEHDKKLAQSSINLQVLSRQIEEYKLQEMDKLKEINDLKQLNLEWEQKTKEILYEIQQNDLILEKKEYERQLQMDECYNLIAQQEEQIQTLNTQLQHQARKEQAALVHAKFNMNRSIIGGGLGQSFVGVSRGQSFVIGNNVDSQFNQKSGPRMMQRVEVESVDELSDNSNERPSMPDNSPDKLDDLAGKLQVLELEQAAERANNQGDTMAMSANGGGAISQISLSQAVSGKQSLVLKEDTNSMPGSLVEQSAEPINANECPAAVVCEQDNVSQKSEELQEVNVEFVEEQGRGEEHDNSEAVAEPPQPKQPINLRRDPEEEFFMLAILALKMQHTENAEAEFIYKIDSQKLFEQIKQIKLPFHKWYTWLDTKFQMMKIAYEQEQEDLYNDPMKNPDGLKNPYQQKQDQETTPSTAQTEDASPFGIFDKIKNFLNRQTTDEKEKEEEQREKERIERQKLLGGQGSLGLRQNFQYKTMRSKNFQNFQKPALSTKSEEIFMLGQPFNMKRTMAGAKVGFEGGSTSNGTILSAGSDTMTTKWNMINI